MELDSTQIDCALRTRVRAPAYLGVFPYDGLPEVAPSFPVCLVVNTLPASAIRELGHWVGVFINKDRVGFYLCSMGCAPYGKIAVFFENNSDYVLYSKFMLQPIDSKLCGYYVITFICEMMRGSSLESFLEKFGSDRRKNDREVFKMIH